MGLGTRLTVLRVSQSYVTKLLHLELHPPRVNFIIVWALFEGGVNLLSSARTRSARSIRGWEEIKEIWYVPHSFG